VLNGTHLNQEATDMERPSLDQAGLSSGKKARLQRILYGHGSKNGTAMFLPYDHGLEHGPRDFFANPKSSDPDYVLQLAASGGFNGIAMHIGLAEKFYWHYAGEVPLILKLNGKTDFPPDDDAFSPLNATVEDAVRLGADAVGYTLYVGSTQQDRDFAQFRQVRSEALRLGMPIIVWAYPRGSAVEAKGGKNSFYAIDYAARTASELGADMVKVNYPDTQRRTAVKPEYDASFSPEEALSAIVRSANRSLVLFSGGEQREAAGMVERAHQAMNSGATGLIIGRNVWQRERSESLRFVAAIREVLEKHSR
jgi:fructose-bisphosphate aldolase, class I